MQKVENSPICQSCSMPMPNEGDFGTNIDGSKNGDYCTYCFQKGNFTEPYLTKDDMVKRVSDMMSQTETGNPEQIKLAVDARIRNLRRWQKKSN